MNIAPGDVPWLTTEQMVEVDRAMIEDFRIELVQMMENAGRNLADMGVAPSLYAGPGLALDVSPVFAHADVIRMSEAPGQEAE